MTKLVIATRVSDLALWQAYHIKGRIETSISGKEVSILSLI